MNTVENIAPGGHNSSPKLSVFDIDHLNEIAIDAGFDCSYIQLEKGRLHARSKFVTANEISIIREQVDRSMEYRGSNDENDWCFLVSVSALKAKIAGVQNAANVLWLIPGGYELSIVTGPSIDIITLLVPKRLIVREFSESSLSYRFSEGRDPIPLGLTSVAMSELSACINACFMGRMDISIGFDLQDQLLQCLVKIIQMNRVQRDLRSNRSYNRLDRISPAIRLIHDNIDRPVSIGELCEVTGFSERTLARSFKEILGVSPYKYSHVFRLNAARKSLSSPMAEAGIVTAVALEHGFQHLSRFSSEFKDHFGVLPSAVSRSTI